MARRLAPIATLFIAGWITACATAPPLTGPRASEPQGLSAERIAVEATLSALQARQQEIQQRIAAATEQAQATEMAHARQVTATADALALAAAREQATATAGALAVQATQTARAADLQATQQALSLQATQAALALQATRQAAEVQREETTASALSLTLLVGTFLAVVAGLALLWNAVQRYLAWQERRNSVLESRAGTLLLLHNEGTITAQLIAGPDLGLLGQASRDDDEFLTEAPQAEAIPYYRDGRLVGFLSRDGDPAVETRRRLCLKLLREAILLVGPDSERLPGHRELGWPAERWVQAVAMLKPHLTTQVGREGGTFCAGAYRTLGELYTALGERRLLPSPAPEVEKAGRTFG